MGKILAFVLAVLTFPQAGHAANFYLSGVAQLTYYSFYSGDCPDTEDLCQTSGSSDFSFSLPLDVAHNAAVFGGDLTGYTFSVDGIIFPSTTVYGYFYLDDRGRTGNNLYEAYLDSAPPGLLSGYVITSTDFSAVAVGIPEPSTWILMVLGFSAIGWAMRRRALTWSP